MAGRLWRESIFDFYTLEGATALRAALAAFTGGRLVVHVTDMPIKCPVAPLEFVFLVEAHLRQRGIRDQVELVYVTPLPGAFTKPVAARRLGHMLDERGIAVEPDFLVERIDEDHKALVSYDEREVPFDLLVTVPLNKGADFVARSGLGDELNYVPVDRHTFLARGHDDIFAIGDANDIPTSKAGSVAHFSVDVFADNFLDHVAGRPMTHSFDGHANCFVESGDGKAMLIDFNYEVEPLPGKFPIPGIGPLTLLDETRANHLGKRAFQWIYWHVLLPGHPMPLPADMSMAGKHPDNPTSPTCRRSDHARHHHRRPPRARGRGGLPHRVRRVERRARRHARRPDRRTAHRRAPRAAAVPARGLPRPGRDGDAAPGQREHRHPDQEALPALPCQARQEDGLRGGTPQAARLRVREEPS